MEITIYTRYMRTRESAHRHIKRRMKLPEYYGANLDALWDCLGDISESTTIRIVSAEKLPEYLGEYGNRLLDIFQQAEKENDMLTIELD